MKKKYIKPRVIDVISLSVECQGDLLPGSYRIYDKYGNLEGSGHILDDMPPDADEEDYVNKRSLWD